MLTQLSQRNKNKQEIPVKVSPVSHVTYTDVNGANLYPHCDFYTSTGAIILALKAWLLATFSNNTARKGDKMGTMGKDRLGKVGQGGHVQV